MEVEYEIMFFPHMDIYTIKKDEPNEKLIHEIIDNFEEDSEILEKQKIMIYFGMRNKDSLGRFIRETLGTVKIKGTTEYEEFREEIKSEINSIFNFETFNYFVYLSCDIRECDDKIFKVFTIAHELQHVIQDICFKCERLRASVLIKYYYLKGMWTNEIYRQIPTEKDAFMKSKKINYKISGKNEVETFLDNKIHEIESKIKRTRSLEGVIELRRNKSYWENIKCLDVESSHDLKNESIEFWEDHEENIEKEIERTKKKKERFELEENEKEFLDTYDRYNRYIGACN